MLPCDYCRRPFKPVRKKQRFCTTTRDEDGRSCHDAWHRAAYLAGRAVMEQMRLLDSRPIAKRVDPAPSHRAAEEVTRTGLRASQQHQTVYAVKMWPSRTGQELAIRSGIDRYVLGRRLPEVERAGYVSRGDQRKCSVTGRLATTWLPRRPVSEIRAQGGKRCR